MACERREVEASGGSSGRIIEALMFISFSVKARTIWLTLVIKEIRLTLVI